MKKYIVSLILLLISSACFITYNSIGSKIEPDNTLSEPFFLIPIAWVMLIGGFVSAIVIVISSKLKNRKR